MSLSKYLTSKPASLKIGKEIGRGGNGTVHEGELEGRPVAVKKIHGPLLEAVWDGQGDTVLNAFKDECKRLESIVNPLIVKFKGAYDDGAEPILVMEKMHRDLSQLLRAEKGTLSYRRQFQLCLDIAKGLHFLHTQDPPLVHRDLTARNVLLDESGRAKIGDLGQSKLKTAAYFQTKQPGAVPYMPPEALAAEPRYDEKIDIFSFGVLMLEIATQREPSPGMLNIGSIEEKDRRQEDLACLPANHPLEPLILKCLNTPSQRPDAATVLEELEQENPLNFQQAKDHLVTCMEEFLQHLDKFLPLLPKQIEGSPTATLTDLSKIQKSLQKMVDATKREQMKVVFLGSTSNGKSTILNALIKKTVLPFGKGSVTSCFCAISAVPPGQDCGTEGYVRTGGVEKSLTAANELANYMKQGGLKAGDVLEIFLPAHESCMWLKQQVVLIDSPGLSAAANVDELIKKTCGDADVFVYVCNGTSTLEEPVKRFLEQVNCQLPNLSRNLFILFNHWDQVVDDDDDSDDAIRQDPKEVKKQHLERVHEFLVDALQSNGVLERTFFVSGREACKAQENEKKGKQPSADCKVLKKDWQERLTEFRKFEKMLQEFLSGSAIETKCGRHWKSCTEYVSQLTAEAENFKTWCREEAEKLDMKLKSEMSLLAHINAAEKSLQDASQEKVRQAMDEFTKMFDEFHDKIKADLRGKVELYRDKSDKEKWEEYQKAMAEDLDEAMKTLSQPLEQQIRTFANEKVEHLQETYAEFVVSFEEPQVQVEQDSLRPELPTCTEMTTAYHARPWFGRYLADSWLALRRHGGWIKGQEKQSWASYRPLEVITVEGEEHRVPQRYEHSRAIDFASATFYIASTALFPPTGVLVLSILGFAWIHKRDELRIEQVKEKIIIHLRKELDARMQAVKSQCLDKLRSFLEAQIKDFNAALADRKQALTEHTKELEQKIIDRCTWTTHTTTFQDQLQQEVKPCLDRFYSRYLQGESA